ncbi:MAG: J domain-containing protein [Candidatus Wallbacteria bacterium]|nr:J domain-containing protein [Candidatus Wallbacteria bacterium]
MDSRDYRATLKKDFIERWPALYKIILVIFSFLLPIRCKDDQLIRSFRSLFVLFLVMGIGSTLGIIFSPLGKIIEQSKFQWINIVSVIIIFITYLFIASWLIDGWLPYFLYVRGRLDTMITRSEVLRLIFLFDGTLTDGKNPDGSVKRIWFPLNCLNDIEPEFRREFLFRFANKIASDYGIKKPFDIPEFQNRTQENQNRKDEQSSQQRANDKKDSQSASPQKQEIYQYIKILGFYELPNSFDDIKSAYRQKMQQYHPDKFAGRDKNELYVAEEMAKKLNAAHDYLEKYYAKSREGV